MVDETGDIRQGNQAVLAAIDIAVCFAAEFQLGDINPVNQTANIRQRCFAVGAAIAITGQAAGEATGQTASQTTGEAAASAQTAEAPVEIACSLRGNRQGPGRQAVQAGDI